MISSIHKFNVHQRSAVFPLTNGGLLKEWHIGRLAIVFVCHGLDAVYGHNRALRVEDAAALWLWR